MLSLTLYRFLPDYRSEQRRSSDTLCFFQALVEGRRQRAGTTTDLARDSQDGIEGPRRTLHDTLIRVVAWIEHRYENVATGEETVIYCESAAASYCTKTMMQTCGRARELRYQRQDPTRTTEISVHALILRYIHDRLLSRRHEGRRYEVSVRLSSVSSPWLGR